MCHVTATIGRIEDSDMLSGNGVIALHYSQHFARVIETGGMSSPIDG